MISKTITANDVKPGMVIIERSDRGAITRRMPVLETGPCGIDASNVHVVATSTGVVQCYFRGAEVEITG